MIKRIDLSSNLGKVKKKHKVRLIGGKVKGMFFLVFCMTAGLAGHFAISDVGNVQDPTQRQVTNFSLERKDVQLSSRGGDFDREAILPNPNVVANDSNVIIDEKTVNVEIVNGKVKAISTVDPKNTPTPMPTPTSTPQPTPVVVATNYSEFKLPPFSERAKDDKMPQSIFYTLKAVGDKVGLPVKMWYPIAMYESKGVQETVTITKHEHSIGIFQVNTFVHKAKGISLTEFRSRLKDAKYNAEWQMPELKDYYIRGKNRGLKGTALVKYIAKYGQRPKWSSNIERAIDRYYKDVSY